ncbi:MAG: hypothetical protein V7632_4706 [Bradyrhizobium sp.]|jgi:hypothetical protein
MRIAAARTRHMAVQRGIVNDTGAGNFGRPVFDHVTGARICPALPYETAGKARHGH